MRRSQCVLDLRGRLAAGEQEAEVAVALGQRAGRDGRGAIEISSPAMPGTARASSWPRTSRSTPARGIGSIITPDAAASRRRSPSGSPSAWRRITSSRLTPTPKRSEREHSPPIERAASSSIHTRPPCDAQLGVDGALAQPERRAGIRGHAGHGRDDLAPAAATAW